MSSHPTRRALVAEGIAALLELSPADLLSAVGVKEIARRAGVGAPALYHHFGTLEGFADAVVAQVFDPGEFGVEAITERVEDVQAAEMPVEIGRAMHRAEFARVRDDPELRVRLGLWALGGTGMDRAYGDMLRVVDGRIAAFAETMIASWGRELSPPFAPTSFVTAHSALLSGSVVRHMVDPKGLDIELFARMAQALTMVMLRVRGDRRTLDDRLTEINYYPLRSTRTGVLSERRSDTAGRLLHAAAELLDRDGLDGVSVAAVARAAGTSASTAYALFDGVEDLATQVVLTQAAAVLDDVGAPAADGLDGVAAALADVAGVLAARTAYAAPYASRLILHAVPADDPLLVHVRAALAAAQDRGAVGAGRDLDAAARALLVLLVGRLFSAAADGPDGAVAHVRDLVFPGLAG